MVLSGSCDPGCTSVSVVVTDTLGDQTINPAITIGSNFTLLAKGCANGNVVWSTGSTSSSLVVTPTVTTDYSVTCTLAACTAPSVQHTIISPQLLNYPAPIVGEIPRTVCVGRVFTVPYSTTGIYPNNNLFIVELSDTLGKWQAPTAVGMVSDTTSGTISAFLEDGFVRHGGYRLRVVATTSTGADTVGIPLEVVSLCSSVTICEDMVSVKSGNWHDPATWSCGRVPDGTDAITIGASHTVTIGVNLTAICQNLKEVGRLVIRTGSKLRILRNENLPEPVTLRSPAVLKPGLFAIDPASMSTILWVKGNRVRFQGTPNSIPLSGSSGGRAAASLGVIAGSLAIAEPSEKTPFGLFGKVESSFSVNTTAGVETEVILSKVEYNEIFSELDIAWRAAVKFSAKVDFEGKIKGKEPDKNPAKEVEVNFKATANDTVKVTFDFGMKLVTSVLESFSVGTSVDNNLRLSVESTGKIAYKYEQMLYHWQKKNAIWKWIPTGTIIQIPVVFTPRVNIYAIAEASAEYVINGELLNTSQHFDAGKKYNDRTGWSDYSLPPTNKHPDGQIAYGVKGTLQAGLKVKAGVFFYDQDARSPKSPNEDGETEETLDAVVEATRGISGECTSDQKGVTVSQFYAFKPELVFKMPVFNRTLEAKLALAVPNIPLSSKVVNVSFCRPDSNCIVAPDTLPNLAYQQYFLKQFSRNTKKQLDTLRESRSMFINEDTQIVSTIRKNIYQYDTLGRVKKVSYSQLPNAPKFSLVYSFTGNMATEQQYDANDNLVENNFPPIYVYAGSKLIRIYEASPDIPGHDGITDITYYPNGYVRSIDYYQWQSNGSRQRVEYSYNAAEGTKEVRSFYEERDQYDADVFHFVHNFTYRITYDMNYREQAVTVIGPGLTDFVNLEGFQVVWPEILENGTFFQGKLIRSVEMLYVRRAGPPPPEEIQAGFIQYTVDGNHKPISFSYYEKVYGGTVSLQKTDPIKWTVCR